MYHIHRDVEKRKPWEQDTHSFAVSFFVWREKDYGYDRVFGAESRDCRYRGR